MNLNLGGKITGYATKHPKTVTAIMVQVALVLLVIALLPTLWPSTFTSLNPLKIDTDPENMLPDDEPVRVYHDNMKEEMSLYDMVVVGVVNEEHPEGVFNPESLGRVYELTQFAQGLRWPDADNPDKEVGVIKIDTIAPSTVDNISQGEQPGSVNFDWLMPKPPKTQEEATAVREKAARIPFLDGTLLSEDGKALAIYLPLTSKDMSGRVYEELQQKISTFEGADEFHITGLPVAEDVFGIEMFKQMAISAPLAMLVVFLLMFFFFRKLVLIISPMIVAVASIIITMSLLIATGNVVHIMSSMIPIFIMPIAVLDAVHIISEFFDRYQAIKDRKKTIIHVIENLFMPMLYTSLTTAVGFGSLALVPIPPVQVFGIFVAFGVLVAWVLTMTFIPAYVMFIKPESLENFGMAEEQGDEEKMTPMVRMLRKLGCATYKHAKLFVVGALAIGLVSIYGISLIQINDNPVKWFTEGHPIRTADRVLNKHFGGTYMAYLTLSAPERSLTAEAYAETLQNTIEKAKSDYPDTEKIDAVFEKLKRKAGEVAAIADSPEAVSNRLESYADDQLFNGPEAEYAAWDKALDLLSKEGSSSTVFKQPDVLRFIDRLQEHLLKTGIVGKSNSLSDIVKTVRRELVSGKQEDFRIPDTASGVAQTLMQYQNSHRPQDLWHLVTPDYRKSVLWIQLKSGDNQDMTKVVDAVDEFMAANEVPGEVKLNHRWFGLTYINVIWQDKMVAGMLQALLGSFVIVFLMMTILYRSALWGLLAMVPLTVTIAVVYAVIGFVGKDYDMPVAVLSSMSLGLAVDYAIHFISRSREKYKQYKSWKDTCRPMFGAPARAISRNVIVAGVGFLPLLAAPLVPYKTVGFFIAAILISAGLATVMILPALIKLLEPLLFPRTRKCCMICNCGTCIVSSIAIVLVIAVNIYHFVEVGWDAMSWTSLVAIIVMAQICYFVGKSKRCKMDFPTTEWRENSEADDEKQDSEKA